ncbi:bifunctional DNA primase/polymerase [Streptomyces sp. NPDC051211]|uniref:bifunctional DNA primase/polymerase n=1 Tax=Streptomyces sp. NPDC051211 TaxID=3154643 RepID=UPI00344D2077
MTPLASPSRAVARWCAEQGWPVHPLAPLLKTPPKNCVLCRAADHRAAGCPCIPVGRWCHGFHAATTDPARIDAWWGANPGFGIGVATGPAGLVVIDVDAHAGAVPARDRILPGIGIPDSVDLTGLANGFHTLAVLAALHGAPDPAGDENTLRVRTPSGGLHLWYRAGAGRSWLCSTGSSRGRALAWQVDVRGEGGYIVAPGTVTEAGRYEAVGPCRTPAELPDWLAGELARTGHLARAQGSQGSPGSQFARAARTAPPPAARPEVPARARQAVLTACGGRDKAAAVLSTVLAEVAECGRQSEGAGFSEKLNRAAYTVGGLVAAGHLAAADGERALQDVADRVRPGQQARARQIIAGGMTAGQSRPLYAGGRR